MTKIPTMLTQSQVFIFFLALILNGMLIKQVEILYVITALFGIYLSLKYKHDLLKTPNQVKNFYFFIFLFLTYLIAHTLINTHWLKLFEWEFSTYRFLILAPLIGIALSYLFYKQEQLFWKALIIGCSFSAIWLILIVESGQAVRMQGYLDNAINRGNAGMMFGLISLIASFAVNGKSWKTLAVLFFLSGVTLSFLSGSRGGWLALILAILTISIVFFRYQKRQYLFALALLLVIFVFLITIFWDSLPIQQRLEITAHNIQKYFDGNPHSSIGHRFMMWETALTASMEKPFWGWGWSESRSVMQWGIDNQVTQLGHAYPQFHNQYLGFLVEVGVVGLLLFLIMFLYPGYLAIKFIRNNHEINNKVYFALLIIVITESLLEFMLSDRTFSHKYFVMTWLYLSLISIIHLSKKD